ncbi:MAG TPA: DUF3467 domain-containing protein [Pirellulales bacterium]|nr:DUF3467 domain-containing protein [Pirellulales bacterium]
MSEPDDREQNEPNPPQQPNPPSAVNEQVQHSSVSARVPETVGRGVFSTGAVVFDGANEFVIDFLVRLGSPHRVGARVVLPHVVFSQYIAALRDNLRKYEQRFGPPAALPAPPPNQPRASISDLYDQLKLSDEVLSGVYSNAVMIGHTPSEFWFDFITTFYPRSAVSCRIFMSAQQIPGLLDTLNSAYQRHRQKPDSPPPPPNS